MKIRTIKVALTIGLIALAISLVFLLFELTQNHPGVNAVGQSNKPTALTSNTGHPVPTAPFATPDLSIYKTDPKWIWWNEQSARDRNFEWKMPITFYGKVIDENDRPVAEATASFIWTNMSLKGTSTARSTSDAAGLFSLKRVRGKLLQVRVEKEGYYAYDDNPLRFEYAAFFEPHYHEPEMTNPVIFRLRKVGEIPSDLVVRETLMEIAPTGQAHFIALRTTRKSTESDADIAIRITRTTSKERKRYDWSASIESVNDGGLIESTDEFMFEAPEEGYRPIYTYEFDQRSPDWKNNLRKKYYVNSKGGRLFGRLEIKFMPKYQNTAAIAVRFFVNPTGSRNLEYQPHKVLPR